MRKLELLCWWAGSRLYRLAGWLACRRRKAERPEPVRVIPFRYSEADQRLLAWLRGEAKDQRWSVN